MNKRAQLREEPGLLVLQNGLVELGFANTQDQALLSFRDLISGYEFIRYTDAPTRLFQMGIRNLTDNRVYWLDSRDASTMNWHYSEQPGQASLIFTASGFPGKAYVVQVKVSLQDDSVLSAWRMSVSGVGSDEAIFQINYPVVAGVLKVGKTTPNDHLVWPRVGEGWLFTNPYPVEDHLPLCAGLGPDAPRVGVGALSARYPGFMPMQFYLYYNNEVGMYLACHDADQHVKSFDLINSADERFPTFRIGHNPGEIPGGDVAISYDTILGVFHGDWYAGADLYKHWARQQWWCREKLWDRDIASWMREGFAVYQMSNYHMPEILLNHSLAEIADEVNTLSTEIGIPLLALVFNFEREGAWTAPKGMFPPREGEEPFRQAMQRLREAGNHGFVYVAGGNWYVAVDKHNPPYDGRIAFDTEGRAQAIQGDNGQVNIYGLFGAAQLCPETPCVEELLDFQLLGALSLGCTVVQIDNFPCCEPSACYNDSHGHPLGFGSWSSQAWNRILPELRRRAKAKNPDCILSTEGISENYIPYLELYDQRSSNMEFWTWWGPSPGYPFGGETIPLFGYVYSGYIGAYLAAFPECTRPEVLYWTRSIGKALAQGVIPTTGRYFPTPVEPNPITLDFYKKVARATAQECWKYIMFGEMLRPPQIEAPQITASYLMFTEDYDHLDPAQRHVVTDSAIQHSAWRAPDGAIGYFFINISQEPVSFEVELSAYDLPGPLYDIDAIVNGEHRQIKQAVDLPIPQQIELEALSVYVFEVSPHL